MTLDLEGLQVACLDVVQSTLWEANKRPTLKEQGALARQLYELALEHRDYLEPAGVDPNVLIRAVRYLAHHHAIPPMRDSTIWFEEMLACLIELILPNSTVIEDEGAFLLDVAAGVGDSLAEVQHARGKQWSKTRFNEFAADLEGFRARCIVSGRWLQFERRSTRIKDEGDVVSVDVMTDGGGRTRKLCELMIPRETLLSVIGTIPTDDVGTDRLGTAH